MDKTLVILGLTSTGKTDLALGLACKFQGELVSADSRQVYKKLDIGTGKLPAKEVRVKKGNDFWEMDGIKVWMYDVADPKRQYTVYNYAKKANKVIEEILKKDKLPIIVGGSGLYLKALLEGLPNLAIPVDLKLRKKLEKLSVQQLQERLQKLSPDRWEKMNYSDKQNPRRLIRAIEIVIPNKVKDLPPPGNIPTLEDSSPASPVRNDMLKIGLTAPREVLYKRINERVVSRIDQGMIEEAERLHREGLSLRRMRQLGLEYGILADYLEGRIKDKAELKKKLQGKIHGFARRQITWFKKEKEIKWFDITAPNFLQNIADMVNEWYYMDYDKKS